MKVSVIIPTRNRPEAIQKALLSLQRQTLQPDEIIVVDSSDDKGYAQKIKSQYSSLPVKWMDAPASVCVQRNIGIRAASGDWILLCDDDIIFADDYLQKLVGYAKANPQCGALAGRLLQEERNQWTSEYPVKNFLDLLWRFIFQLSIWGDLSSVKTSLLNKPLLLLINKFYQKRDNGFTLSGWPLITSWSEVFQTSIYSLGANLIRREWLLQSPYDEVLDKSGIGDNYGVALGFPQHRAIHVLSSTVAHHARATQNRLVKPIAYYRRIMALHYFIKRSGNFPKSTPFFFIWSLMGNAIMYSFKRDREMYKATKKAMILISKNKNPYWIAYLKGQKIVEIFY